MVPQPARQCPTTETEDRIVLAHSTTSSSRRAILAPEADARDVSGLACMARAPRPPSRSHSRLVFPRATISSRIKSIQSTKNVTVQVTSCLFICHSRKERRHLEQQLSGQVAAAFATEASHSRARIASAMYSKVTRRLKPSSQTRSLPVVELEVDVPIGLEQECSKISETRQEAVTAEPNRSN